MMTADGGPQMLPKGDSGTMMMGQDTGTMQQDTGTNPPPPCMKTLIDDMEHGDGTILKNCGRVGAWYTYNDQTAQAVQTPSMGANFIPDTIPNGGRMGSLHAAHTSGMGFTTWGAGMGFDVNNAGMSKQTYDASMFAGIRFWVMSQSGAMAVRFNVADKDTDPAGGVCSPMAKCNDHFGSNLSVSSTWQQISVKFSDMKQQGWGQPANAFNPSTMYGVQFQFAPNVTFDLWVDDIEFY
jgi:hypothetical protein